MRLRFSSVAVALLALLAAACTGSSSGENNPGTGAVVDQDSPPPGVDQGGSCLFNGSVAVDDRTDTAYLLQTFVDARCSDWAERAARAEKALYAVDADGELALLASMTGRTASQLIFSEDRVVVLSQPTIEIGGNPPDRRSRIDFYDPFTLAPRGRVELRQQLTAAGVSASRRFLAANDVASRGSPISVIDARELAAGGGSAGAIMPVPHGGDQVAAAWLHHQDRLVVISFWDGSDPSRARATLRTWSPAPDGALGEPEIEIDLPGVAFDLLGSLTRIAITPDDRFAAIPVRRYVGAGSPDFGHQVIVLDLESGTMRSVDDARGPVGFTPDSSTIVSYRTVGGNRPHLLLLDLGTLSEDLLEIPGIAAPQFFVTREGNAVVVASTFGNDDLVVFDLDQRESTRLPGLRVELREFVSIVGRGELWLVDDGLYRLDFFRGQFEQINIGWEPWHIARLAHSDTLLLDDVQGGRLVYFEPVSQTVVGEIDLRRAGNHG